jgi:hypothetical protein
MLLICDEMYYAMKINLLVLFFIGISSTGFAQNFTGQWKGSFIDKSTAGAGWGGDECEYVLDLESKGTVVSGYSYTYFTDEGKRFYTICKLKGFIDKAKKYVEVTEIERTKTNTPPRFNNCFQVHRLSYSNSDGNESLTGSWVPAPDQNGNCGSGTTALYRRALSSAYPRFNNSASKAPNNALVKNTPKKPVAKAPLVSAKKPAVVPTKKPTVAATKPAIAKVTTPAKPPRKETTLTPNKGNMSFENLPSAQQSTAQITPVPLSFEKRNTTLLKTLEVENVTVKVELYDNGEIDGDSISLYYNGDLLLAKKRLSDKAITLTLPVPLDKDANELVMFAENLGTIPPNTALMVVTDGTKRYEVRITSDLQKSGTIRFVHKDAVKN